jgi:hypothetical protein
VRPPVCPICHTSTSTGARFPGVSCALQKRPDRFLDVRYIALLVLAVVFLTGLVWWVVFLGNAALRLIRRR